MKMNVLDPLGSRAFLSALGKRFLESFGFFWLLTEPAGLFFPEIVPGGWPAYAGLVVLSAVSGTALAWPKKSVSASIPGANVQVTIKVGDIFSAEDNVVIGTNDVFDTHIGDDIISPRSVQAQLVQKRFGGSVPTFDRAIQDELAGKISRPDPSKTRGKNERYALGTVVELKAEGIRHYLCAYCRMPATLKAETDVCTLLASLSEIWEKVRNSGQNQGVSMPVLASDFGRTGLTQTQLIQLIVLSFVGANKVQHVAPSLTIYVHEGSAGLVDFAALRLWLRGVLWA